MRDRLSRILTLDLKWQQLVGILIFLYLLFATGIWLWADKLMFLPPKASYRDSAEILKLPVTNGENIAAIDLPNARAKYTILYIHGNGEDLGESRDILVRLQSNGFRVFAYDYRGYGTSDGKPGEANAYQDAETAYAYLTQTLKIPADRLIIYGRSIGGGSALELASRHRVAGIILESTFTSAFSVVLPFPIVPFDKFRNIDKITNLKSPILLMHGTNDTVVPVRHGRQLLATITAPKLSLFVDGAGHDDLPIVAGNNYDRILREFQELVDNNPVN